MEIDVEKWDDEGGASVREPRRPKPKDQSGSAELPKSEESEYVVLSAGDVPYLPSSTD